MIKLKGKIKDYLETYWRRGRFLKGVSLIVLACFMLNIISPALARAEGTTQDLKEKQDTVKQQMASGSVSGGGATGPVNQQINVGDLGGAVKLSQEDKIAMSKQAITVTEQGNVMKKDSAQPIAVVDLKSRQVIAVIGNNGQLIDKDKNKDKFEKQKEDVQARVDQFFGKGGQPGGQYKDTVGKEYMTESKATDSRTENRQDVKDAAAGTKKTENTAQKDKKQANNEGTPKDIDADKTTGKKIEETVKQDKTELAKNRQVNEESQDEKKSKLQAAVKKNPKDENSASEVTIAMVQSSASNLAGLQLIAVRDNDDNKEKAKISLYTSELTGDNIFVGKSGGQMSYASRSGSIDVTDASDVINMEGNTYKDTGISLVEGEEKDQDAGINKNLKGLFSGEQLRVFAGRLDGVAPEAISASGEEAVFNDAKLSANKIMENMDLSGEDKKAVAVAENMDELKAAVNNIKAERKGVAFKVLLLSVIAKEENKGKAEFAAGVEKDMVLAQAKDEMFEAVDGKGFKGAGARFVAALSLSGTSLTAKERAAILKAGSTEQLKTIAGKYANMKGFIGKAIAAKLNAIAEKAEAAGNAAGGEAKSGAQADGEYDPATVNALMNQTGLSRDEVIKNFDKTKEECKKIDAENGLPEGTTFNKEMAVLKEYLAKGGSILNCASDALKNVLSGVSEGLLALQALCAEMSIGNFNEQSLTSGISAAAVMIVENQHGIQSAGYSVKTDDFVKGMNAGDKAIVWVNANHYVTVIKNEDGTLSVLDPNKNNGKALTYSGEEFKKLMSGVTATTTNGQNVQGYAKVTDANGQMKVITDSKGVAERGIKIGITDMKNIRGAKNTVVGKIGKGIGNAAKWAWKGVKNAAKWCWKELGKVPGLSEYINVWATAIGAIAGLFKGLWQEIKGQEKRIEGERYDKVLDELEKQTGMTRDELQGALDGLDNNTFNRAIKVLEDLFSAGGSIISCVVESMSATLGITNKGLLAFQSFLIDISTRPHGSFVDNAGYVDKDGVYVPWKMLNTTFNAAKKVLQSYGIDARIVSISLDDFMASLKPGESAIVDVKVKNDNNNKTNHHAIKISKEIDEETGKEVFIVTDNLENEGKPVVYTPEGLKTLLSGGKAVDKDGNDVDTGHYGAYSANSVEFGKLEVLTSSQGVIKAGKESIEQSFTESMEIGIKGGKSIASGIGQFFDWVGGLFGRGSKKSPYDKAKANLEAAQRDALNAALPISSNGQPYSEDRLKKAYEALDKAEAAFLAACKTDKERTDAGILIEESRIKIESAALTTLARYYDSGTQKANKAFDDFMAGNITIGQYAQIVSGVNEGRGNILNKAKALSARIDALNDKKRAAGYEVSEADVKESKKIIENIICAQQDYVVSAIENSFMSPKGKEILIGQKELEGQSGLQGQGNGSSNYFISSGEIARYVNSLAALAVVTEELNKMYDKVYGNTPEGAAAKKQRNEYVVSKIEEKQSGMNKYFIETVSATIDRIKAYDPTQAVVNAKDNKTSLDKYKETLQDIAKEGDDVLNAMLKLAESFSGDLADRIRDTGYTAKLASIGITVDSGTITQKGVDENGNVIEREMKYKDTGIDAEIRKIIAVSGWDAAVEFLSSKNLLEENVADTGTSSAQGAEKVQDSGINKNTKAQSAGETAGRLDGVAPEAISASGEETVFNDAKSKATKIADKMNLSGEDKKAIGNAKNIDELETAIGNIKEKGILFKALLLSVTNKEENKGKGFMLSKGKELVLAQAKGEMLKAIDGKGVKGVGARLVAALGFSSMSLTAKERALIAKAGSIQELKAIANKYANMKGLFGKTIGKAIAAKLNAVIAKAESAENAESGEKKDAEAGNKSGDEYDPAMVQAIMDQTGVSRDEAIASLDKAKEEAKKVDAEKGLPEGTTFNQEMALLKDYLAKGGSILNCASSALFTDLGGAVSEGLLALQALSVELATGNLTSESVQGGQLSTSMNAMNEVLHSYGKDSAGYAVNAKDLAGSLKAGDKAILWVDGNHYVTVMKNEDGTMSVIDPNKNNGKALTYSTGEFNKLISGGTAKTTDGQSVAGYTKVADQNGQVKVITDSKAISTAGTKMSVTDMKNVRGAKNTVVGKIGKGIGNAAKWAWKGIKNAAKWAWNGAWKGIKNAANWTWKTLKKVPVISKILDFASGYITKVLGALFGFFKGLWQGAKGQEKRIEGDRYDKVLDELEKETGMSRDELKVALDGLDNNTFNRAIRVLEELFAAGGDIISCVVRAISATLGTTNIGLIAFQAFLIDIATRPVGYFVEKGQLSTMPYAAAKVLQSYGIDAGVYAIQESDFMSSLKPGESAIVFVKVDGGSDKNYHAIKVSKEIDEETGEEIFIVTDNIANDGKPVAYTSEGFKALMSGGKPLDKDGNEVDFNHTYNGKFLDFGQMLVVTDSPGVKRAGSEEFLESAYDSAVVGIKAGKSIAAGVGQFFDWVGGLFGRGSKKSEYDKAKSNLEAAQRDALNAALPISSNGQPYSEDRLKKAYEALDKAEAAFLAACKTDKERTDAGILIEESRIKIESTALTTLVRYYDVDTKKANKAFDDFMAGNITIDQYAQIISGVNEGRGDILNRAMALSARIDALVAKKRAAGYEVSEDEIKESKKFVDNILFAQQDYVLSAINNLSLWSGTVSNLKKEDLLNFINGNKEDTAGDNTGGAGKGTMIISTDGVRSISQEGVESYINSLAALAVVTEELNKLYDKVYGNTPECAAAKEQRNEYVVSKIEEKQNEINKSFINAINNTIKQASKDANGQPVQVTGNYLENIRNIAKAGDDIMNAMLKLAESFSGDSADRIRDIGYTAKLASMGITVDSGTITQKGVDENGNVIEREMKYKDTGIDAKIREIIAVSGWDAAFDFLKSNNLLI